MNRYSITETEESGIYERGDNYLNHITIRDILTTAKSDPSSVLITITNPCGAVLVDAQAMSTSEIGIYYYDYSILANAPYGKYNVEISTATFTMSKTYSYYVFPWNVNKEVRELAGIGEQKSITDRAINGLIWNAYNEVRHEVFSHHYDEQVRCNCCNENCRCSNEVCSTFDGTNTTFWTQEGYLADYTDNGIIQGYGEAPSCCTDIWMTWKDCDGDCHYGYVEVLDAMCGKLKLTTNGINAIPSAYAWVKLEYWTRTRGWTRDLMHQAIEYLAAHKVLLRLGELERATSADLVAAQNIKYVNPARMYKEYRRILKKIRLPPAGGVY
jgi:hypothetical protein